MAKNITAMCDESCWFHELDPEDLPCFEGHDQEGGADCYASKKYPPPNFEPAMKCIERQRGELNRLAVALTFVAED